MIINKNTKKKIGTWNKTKPKQKIRFYTKTYVSTLKHALVCAAATAFKYKIVLAAY